MPAGVAVAGALFVAGSSAAIITAAIVNGIIIGAIIGGVTSAIKGGNIMKGILTGALIGGVTAGLASGLGQLTQAGGWVSQASLSSGVEPVALSSAGGEVMAGTGDVATTASTADKAVVGLARDAKGGKSGWFEGMGKETQGAMVKGGMDMAAAFIAPEDDSGERKRDYISRSERVPGMGLRDDLAGLGKVSVPDASGLNPATSSKAPQSIEVADATHVYRPYTVVKRARAAIA